MSVLRSVDDEKILGFYNPFFLYAYVKRGFAETRQAPAQLQNSLSAEQLFQYALARYTFFHELRHFHDYFGTLAGISLFFSHLRQVRAFASFCETVRANGAKLALPFDQSFGESDETGKVAKGLIRNWRMFLRATAGFVDAYEKTTAFERHPEDHVIYKATDNPNLKIPTFPMSSLVQHEQRLTPLTVYYPIGMETLAEGNTQALQRSLMELECPAELIERLVPVTRPGIRPIHTDDPAEEARNNALPYNVTDLLVSKYLRLRGHPKFRRASILQITDQTLSEAHIWPRTEPWEVPAQFEYVNIGAMFIDILENAKIEDLRDGTVPCPAHITDAYRVMLEQYDRTTKPENVEYTGDLISPVAMIESVVVHYIIKPLITARLETNHEVFWSTTKYLEKLPTLPEIPVVITGQTTRNAQYMRGPNIGDAWTKYCLLIQCMRDLYALRDTVKCFRAGHLPLDAINLCTEGDCSTHIRAGECDGWKMNDALPPCVFASLLRRLTLAQSESPQQAQN